jgi:hypothetical protein
VSVQTKEISGIGERSNISLAANIPTSGIASENAPDEEALRRERLRVREHIAFLNQLMRLVNKPPLSEEQQQRVREKTRAVKLYLMRSVWDPDWGPFEVFQLWADGSGKAIDSEAFRRSTDFWVYGQEKSQ